MKKIVIIGATSAIAEHCARLWVKQSIQLILVVRDVIKAERIAADLRIRSPKSQIEVKQTDFDDPLLVQECVQALTQDAPVDSVLIAHGYLPNQQQCQADLALSRQALLANAISPWLFAEAFAGAMQAANHGTLAIIGSVAGDRGRKSNYVYGAAKGLLERLVQGLQHRLANTKVKVILIKPGPTDTPMTAHLPPQPLPLAKVGTVAAQIVKGMERGKPVIYAPAKWGVIMFAIRLLPARIFNQLDM